MSPDAEGVSEGDEAHAFDQADAGVGTLQQLHGCGPSLQNHLQLVISGIAGWVGEAPLVRPVDLICQHIEQYLHHNAPIQSQNMTSNYMLGLRARRQRWCASVDPPAR